MKEKKNKFECEGNCVSQFGGHNGDVFQVWVSGNNFVGAAFNYCRAAIKEDESRGFKVKIMQQLTKG